MKKNRTQQINKKTENTQHLEMIQCNSIGMWLGANFVIHIEYRQSAHTTHTSQNY